MTLQVSLLGQIYGYTHLYPSNNHGDCTDDIWSPDLERRLFAHSCTSSRSPRPPGLPMSPSHTAFTILVDFHSLHNHSSSAVSSLHHTVNLLTHGLSYTNSKTACSLMASAHEHTPGTLWPFQAKPKVKKLLLRLAGSFLDFKLLLWSVWQHCPIHPSIINLASWRTTAAPQYQKEVVLVVRMHLRRIPLEVFQTRPTGRRPWGRSRTLWSDYLFVWRGSASGSPQEVLERVAGVNNIWDVYPAAIATRQLMDAWTNTHTYIYI